MLASDTLASYGSLARYKDVRRIRKVGGSTLIGASGEYSDFQSIIEMLDVMHQSDVNIDDGYTRSPSEFHSYLRAVLYNRRNKFNPLWNQLLVAGYKDAPFLGYVDLIGTSYEENFIATDMEEGEARALLEDCLRVLFYRDCRASNKIQIAKATEEGTLISDPYEISHDWETANFDVRHGAPADGSSW
ncbi:PBG1 [Symbiodinium microadriaticum]|nr:PBG1 [Symbiodinium microadriaticum]